MKSIICFLCLMTSVYGLTQNRDEHMTYNGQFGNNSFDKATYSYILNEDGERVFDGPFKYDNSVTTYIGNFTNNLQTGKWVETWVNKKNGPKALLKRVTTVNFNDKGLQDGAFLIQDYYRNGKVINVVKANFKNGFVDGPFEVNDFSESKSGHKATGQFDMGVRTGKWTDSWINGDIDYDHCNEYGYPLVKTVDESTGDIEKSYGFTDRFDWTIQNLLQTHPYRNDYLHMRDSKILIKRGGFYDAIEIPEDLCSSTISFDVEPGLDDIRNKTYEFDIRIPRTTDNTSQYISYKKDWSDWEDLLLGDSLLVESLTDNSMTNVKFPMVIEPDGKISFADERDNENPLKRKTLELLEKLQWNHSYKRHPIAICYVKVNYNGERLKSIKQKKAELEKEEAYRKSDDYVYERADEMPKFPGGPNAMLKFIKRNIVIPKTALNELYGRFRVHVKFVVWKDGSVKQPKIMKSSHPDLDNEVLRVVNELPSFTPGKKDGKPVNVYHQISIPFQFSE